jgi:hypothetical protein
MMTRRLPNARRAKASVLEDRMNILNRNEVEFPFAWQVFGTVSNILALVKVHHYFLLPFVDPNLPANRTG